LKEMESWNNGKNDNVNSKFKPVINHSTIPSFQYSSKGLIMRRILVLIIILLGISLQYSCTTVKPYQRIFLNDPEMQMGSNAGKAFENYVLNIREGSIVPGSKKASGGCGCN